MKSDTLIQLRLMYVMYKLIYTVIIFGVKLFSFAV